MLNLLLLTLKIDRVQLTFFNDLFTLRPFSVAINILVIATDVSISAILVFLLNKSKTGFRRSHDVLNRLVRAVMDRKKIYGLY